MLLIIRLNIDDIRIIIWEVLNNVYMRYDLLQCVLEWSFSYSFALWQNSLFRPLLLQEEFLFSVFFELHHYHVWGFWTYLENLSILIIKTFFPTLDHVKTIFMTCTSIFAQWQKTFYARVFNFVHAILV